MSPDQRPVEILLVEDSPTDRLIAIEALGQAFAASTLNTVENGVEAMAYLRREGKYSGAVRPDLILLDLNLPKKDGREVLVEIKNDPLLKYIPVVVLTTSAAEDDIVGSYGHYANSFIRKPVDFTRFTEMVRSIGDYWFRVVTLPTEDAVRRVSRTLASHTSAPRLDGGQTLRVLLIEDDPSSVLLVRCLLEESTLATFALESVSRIAELSARRDLAQFDIVVTDLGLPDSQGLETYRQVQRRVAGRPVIVLTGLDDEAMGLAALREGAQDYLVKGELTSRALSRAVRYAIDKKRIEEQLRQTQRLEAVGQLAAGVAHDFNNVLTIIQGQSRWMEEEGRLPPESAEALGEIIGAADRAAALTRQLLTFSHQQVVHRRDLAMNDVVSGVALMLRRLLGEQISLELRLTAEGTDTEADLSMMEQILMNLAVNARDAMPGGGTLTLTTSVVDIDRAEAARHADAYPGRFVKIVVADTGAGIVPDVMPHIFEPFFTTKDVGKGIGLGLATVFSMVQQHRGWIEVFSTVHEGSRFESFLPWKAATRPAVMARPASSAGGRETILIVEDEPGVRRMAATVLVRKGYRVYTAGSGAEALAVWNEHGGEVDLLFSDLVMPGGMGGQELAAALTLRKPGLKIVFASGYSTDFVGGAVPLREGANFLQKPYSLNDLTATLRAALDEGAAADGPT